VSLLPFLATATLGALVAAALRGRGRVSVAAGFVAVGLAVLVLAVASPGEPLEIGGGALALTPYSRVLLGVALAGCLGALAVGRLVGPEPAAPTAILVAAGGLGLAIGTAGSFAGLLALGATAVLAAAAALAGPPSPARALAMAAEMRGAAAALVVGLVVVSLVPEGIGGLAVSPQLAGLAAVAAGAALADRLGAIPLHARVARLADATPPAALPTLLVLLPAGWAVVMLGWVTDALGPAEPALGWDGALLVLLGIGTMVLGTVAALLQDDVGRITTYTIVLDAGVLVLGFASLDPVARDAARAWLVPFVATRSALLAWAVAFRAAFGTARLSETRGWLRRAPALGAALVAIGVAAVGWPGLMVWDARLTVLGAATAGVALAAATAAGLGTAVALARVVGAGLGRPAPRVREAPGELARVPPGLRVAAGALRGPAGRRHAALAAARQIGPLVELNRAPLRALIVVVLAGVALLGAAGGFGIREAAALPDVATPAPRESIPPLEPGGPPGTPAPTPAAPGSAAP